MKKSLSIVIQKMITKIVNGERSCWRKKEYTKKTNLCHLQYRRYNNVTLQVEKPSVMANKIKENLLLLFERPREPVFMPKGPNQSVFTVPEEFLVRLSAL